jgi:hypothetical protein
MDKESLKSRSDVEISLEKRYEIIREQIRHEDGLINQRLNWLLLSQGFLIAAFTTIVTTTNIRSGTDSDGLINFMVSTNPLIFILTLPVIGLSLNYFSFIGLHDAYKSLRYLRCNWRDARPTDKKGQRLYDSFPHITWEGNAITTASSSPIVITLAWMCAAEWMLLTITYNDIQGILMWMVAAICIGIAIRMGYLTNKSLK